MNIIPAIDLIDSKAVRLIKGDYDKVTVYSDNPVEVAKSFEEAGAKFLHIVDLNGAKDGTTANFETIKKIVTSTNLSVDVGGGIRDIERIERYINIGVDRVIIGTAAITDPEFLLEAVERFGEKIVVGVEYDFPQDAAVTVLSEVQAVGRVVVVVSVVFIVTYPKSVRIVYIHILIILGGK